MKATGPVFNIDSTDYQLEIRDLEQRDVDAFWDIFMDWPADHLGAYSKYRAMMDTNISVKENEAFTGKLQDERQSIVLVANGRVVGINQTRFLNGVATDLRQAIVPELRSKGLGTQFNYMLRKYGFEELGIGGAEFQRRKDNAAVAALARQLELEAPSAEVTSDKTGAALDVYSFTKEQHEARLKADPTSAEAQIAFALEALDEPASRPEDPPTPDTL